MSTKHRHFIIHKPFGFLSQFILVNKRKSQKLLGELYDFPEKTMAIGRLDQESEGLLLLTTDGKTSALVNSSKIEKEYYAQVDGLIDEAGIKKLQMGVAISVDGKKYLTKPCKAQKLIEAPNFPPRIKKIRDDRHGPTSWVSVTLREGKYRQIRKMTAAIGFATLRLFRVRIGEIELGTLEAGAVQEVEQFALGLNKNVAHDAL